MVRRNFPPGWEVESSQRGRKLARARSRGWWERKVALRASDPQAYGEYLRVRRASDRARMHPCAGGCGKLVWKKSGRCQVCSAARRRNAW
jgi:hypothetical protein